MIALDTNVLVRVVTNDDPVQARAAARRMSSARCWVGKTVLLETEWVLRYAYGLERHAIQSAFTTLLAIASIEVEDRAAVEQAVAWHAAGLDFADALHLASASSATAFVTFDRALRSRARRAGAKPAAIAP